jgi:hypothetical protein
MSYWMASDLNKQEMDTLAGLRRAASICARVASIAGFESKIAQCLPTELDVEAARTASKSASLLSRARNDGTASGPNALADALAS